MYTYIENLSTYILLVCFSFSMMRGSLKNAHSKTPSPTPLSLLPINKCAIPPPFCIQKTLYILALPNNGWASLVGEAGHVQILVIVYVNRTCSSSPTRVSHPSPPSIESTKLRLCYVCINHLLDNMILCIYIFVCFFVVVVGEERRGRMNGEWGAVWLWLKRTARHICIPVCLKHLN